MTITKQGGSIVRMSSDTELDGLSYTERSILLNDLESLVSKLKKRKQIDDEDNALLAPVFKKRSVCKEQSTKENPDFLTTCLKDSRSRAKVQQRIAEIDREQHLFKKQLKHEKDCMSMQLHAKSQEIKKRTKYSDEEIKKYNRWCNIYNIMGVACVSVGPKFPTETMEVLFGRRDIGLYYLDDIPDDVKHKTWRKGHFTIREALSLDFEASVIW